MVQILPFHKLGTVKYQRLHKVGPMPQCDPPDDELIDRCVKQLEELELPVMVH